jgi:hypothetical protein
MPSARARLLFAVALALHLATWPHSARAEPLAPFTTDGCSRFPDGTHSQPTLWQDCCIAHDAAYWAGGTADQRAQADQLLRQCVAAKHQPSISALMLMGVRLGGSPFIPTPFRWGYGWSLWRGYAPLTDPERLAVRRGWPRHIAQPAYLVADPSPSAGE